MWALVLGLVLFFGIHLVRVYAGPFRNAQISASETRWKGIYSLISLAGFALIIWGFGLYRPEAPQVFAPPDWGRDAAMLLVLLAFVIIPTTYLPVGHIKKTLKHPMLTAVILWSAGHLLANGDLAALLLFGGFLAYSIIDRIAVLSRPDPAPEAVSLRSDIIAIVAGGLAYAALLFWLHPILFGVALIG